MCGEVMPESFFASMADATLPDIAPFDDAHARARLDDVVAAYPTEAAHIFDTHEALFLRIGEGSSFLASLLRRYPEVVTALSENSAEAHADNLLNNLPAAVAACKTRDEVMSALRHTRNQIALVSALADLSGIWDVAAVTGCLTRLADICVSASFDWLVGEAVADGKLAHASQAGLIVLAMGKHGGCELNYSSDIDLIVFYTPDAMPVTEGVDTRKFFITLVRDMAALLQTPTADGFAFRVDLRLRPDPGATQVAISVSAALSYYETVGQNWERAVYIKARPIAGDLEAGENFLLEIGPFVWRRYYDFAAIEDVHSMKRQIHAVRGHGEIAVRGHNMKLGRGGIREIEFFVQTQQLIAGGRDPVLRGRTTVGMLDGLSAAGWISSETAAGMTEAYAFLRRLEHCLQMRLDEQTHTLPEDDATLEVFARFAGFKNAAALTATVTDTLQYVASEYALLFEHAESLSTESGNLVFTGNDDDPDTLENLTVMGFKRPRDVSAIIRGWHAGRVPPTKSPRAREILTRLMPSLLEALARANDPDEALIRFNQFLEKLPAGVQFFSLLQSNDNSLKLLVDIVGVAPRLSAWLSRNAQLVDILIETRPTSDDGDGFEADEGVDFADILDALRLDVHHSQFRTGVFLLANPTNYQTTGIQFADIARRSISRLLPAAQRDIAARHGSLEQVEMAVIGMGKLGSGEMSLQSDLDLVIVCDSSDFAETSDGEKPLAGDVWMARAARRLISGLTVPTQEGSLYNVDMRLRPSGNAGPLVTKMSSFTTYQQNDAWTWEHMALTQASVIAGSPDLVARLNAVMADVICRQRNKSVLADDVEAMRQRLFEHQKIRGPLDVKNGPGGLIDIEFMVQGLILAYAADCPAIASPRGLAAALGKLHAAELVSRSDYELLLEAGSYYAALRQISGLCLEPDSDAIGQGATEMVLNAVHAPDPARLQAQLGQFRDDVSATFTRVMAGLRD